MKKRKQFSFFLAGITTSLLIIGTLTTALAASGTISYNSSNVSLNGEQKITAGADLTAANGQKVPSSILYVDEAGGKTNYLPIRAISELLGVEIDYDSATKTVLLGSQPAVNTTTARQWQRDLKDGTIHYAWPEGVAVQEYSQPPIWRPTWLPDNWSLHSIAVNPRGLGNLAASLSYRNGKSTLEFFCCYPAAGRMYGEAFGINVDTAALLQEAQIRGRSADFYQIEDRAILVWENDDGNLFWLSGNLDRTTMERVADSVSESKAAELPSYKMGWTPVGNRSSGRIALPGMAAEQWSDANGTTSFDLIYTSETLAVPEGTPEAVTVNGVKAQYWAGDPKAGGISMTVNGEVKTIIPTEGQKSTLLWTDPDTNLVFRIQGVLEKDVLIRMAESVSLK